MNTRENETIASLQPPVKGLGSMLHYNEKFGPGKNKSTEFASYWETIIKISGYKPYFSMNVDIHNIKAILTLFISAGDTRVMCGGSSSFSKS